MAGFGTFPFGTSSFGIGVPGGVGLTVYSAAREGFLDGTVAWTIPTIEASLVRGYTFSDSHRFVSDMTGTVVSTATLVSKTATGGIADAGDTTFTAVAAGATIPAAIIFQASAVTGGADVAASAQRLIGFVDLSAAAVVPTGADITLSWSGDRSRIFML